MDLRKDHGIGSDAVKPFPVVKRRASHVGRNQRNSVTVLRLEPVLEQYGSGKVTPWIVDMHRNMGSIGRGPAIRLVHSLNCQKTDNRK